MASGTIVPVAQSANFRTSVRMACRSARVRAETTVTIVPTPSRSALGRLAVLAAPLTTPIDASADGKLSLIDPAKARICPR